MNKIFLALKVFRQLGWRQGFLYAWYQFLLRSGFLHLLTYANDKTDTKYSNPIPLKFNISNIQMILKDGVNQLVNEANAISEGEISLFGELKMKLDFTHPGEIKHWTKHQDTWIADQDIKVYWEMARFSWATILARAYAITKNEKYAQSFWAYTEEFLETNPVNLGIHWVSAQEVAIRLICLSFCYSIFENSTHTTPERKSLFAQLIADHASRITPTFSYSRAQNNNHLLTEAVGLYTAAALLPHHPKAKKWRSLGWKWFNSAVQTQIMENGSFVQNSSNYHRVLLQSALWAKMIAKIQGDDLPLKTAEAMASATKYLFGLLDQNSGRVPNLGPNDGAYFLPLTVMPFSDYRPVLQAARRVFLGHSFFPPGEWDEYSEWMNQVPLALSEETIELNPFRIDSKYSWASIRAVKHQHRPGHADQLHVEIWWQGLNIAQDAGSYLYNAASPWQNALGGADVHNTVQINDQDQMFKASRFLYLDWTQATIIKQAPTQIIAEHDGYLKQGIIHRRSLKLIQQDQWQVKDTLTSQNKKNFVSQLHWLLPDWPWQIGEDTIHLDSPKGPITLRIESGTPIQISLVRAGEILYGKAEFPPHRGWVSPTYALKKPALSFAIRANAQSQVNLTSIWQFPQIK